MSRLPLCLCCKFLLHLCLEVVTAYGAFLDRVEVDAEVKTRELMAGMTEEELRALAQLDGEW